MGRLIDTDVIEAFIKNHSCCVGTDGELLTVGEDGKWNNLLEYIPTAYDVDKVAREIRRNSGNGYRDVDGDYIPPMIETKEAIEIVKQGVIFDDVCEWRLCDEEANVYDTSCRNPHILIDGAPEENNYKYCPYCGKKIKVVDDDK